MAISKLILNGEVQMDVTSDTVSAGNMLSGITGTKKDGTKATGNIATRTSANLTASGSTVTAAAGYYATSVSKSVAAGSAFPPAVTITKNPTFSFVSSTGKITASYTGSSSVTPTVTSGYVTAGTAGTISTTGTSTYTLTTQAAQTLYPSTADQTVASYRWLTGTQTFKSVTTSNLTAENIAEGVVVKVGDSGNASRITQVTGTHSGATTYTATISGSGNSNYCYVQTSNGTKYYTNNSTFTFKEGDILVLYSRGSNVRIDNSDSLSLTSYSYSYSLPSHDITIELTYSGTTSNSVHLYTSHYMGYIVSTVNTGCYITYNSNNYSEYGTKIIFKYGDSVTIRATNSAGTQGTDIYLNGEKVVNASSTATTYTFTPNQHFEIRWADSGAYIITYKLYTCTIGTTSGTGKTLKYNGINYGANTTFQFKAGDICLINAYGQYGGGTIYEDGVQIGTSDLDQMYTYILPASNIEVTINGNGDSRVDISTEKKNFIHTATITGIGDSGRAYVSYNNTYYYSAGSFQFVAGEDLYVLARGSDDGGGSIYYDGTCLSTSTFGVVSTTVSLPAFDLAINLDYGAWATAYLSTPTVNISSNGLYDVKSYGAASVSLPYYEIYKACVMAGSLYSSGISNESYKYTSTEVNNFCNSFSTISSRALEGIGFRGSFYFNNAKSIQEYAFGSAWGGNGTTMFGGLGYFYFPQVSRINIGAFIFNKNLKYIEAPSCTLISNWAFQSCLSLTDISFPNCSTIGYSAFAYCVSLTSINFPECLIISNSAFGSCSGLISISFPKCSIVSYCAFVSCHSLISAIFPECTKVDVGAFSNCSALTTIDFPKCTQIGNYAFASCGVLTTAIFSSCTIIGNYAFNKCSALTIVDFPKCTQIGNYAFSGCYELSIVSFPSCTSVSYNAFIDCSSLGQINLPQCSIIGLSAFSKCTSLRTVSLPICTSIGNNAFQSCYNLISLYLNSISVVPSIGTNTFYSTPISTYSTVAGRYGSVFVPSSLYADFLSHSLWASYSARLVSV